MVEATELIARSINDGARAIHNRAGGLAAGVRGAAHGPENADAVGAHIINRYSFSSTDDQGATHYFQDIRVEPLVDHEGRTVGISFPTKSAAEQGVSDEEAYSTWARMPNQLAETEFFPGHRVTPADGGEPYWEDTGPSQRAPWADDARDGMLYVHAHAGPDGFRILANAGTETDPDWKLLALPGGSFGQFLAANEDLRAASLAGPDKPLMMLACTVGNPVYAHAEQAAEVIHRAGMNHDVYAMVGINSIRYKAERGTAEIGAEVPDGTMPSDAITVIRAPNRPPAP